MQSKAASRKLRPAFRIQVTLPVAVAALRAYLQTGDTPTLHAHLCAMCSSEGGALMN